MKKFAMLSILGVLAAVSLSGCFGKEDEAAASCSQSSLEGNWATACRQSGGGGNYKREFLVITTGNVFSYSEYDFGASATCAGSPTPSTMGGVFTVGGCGNLTGSNVLTITPAGSGDVGCGAGTAKTTVFKNDGTNFYMGNDGGSGSSCATASTDYDSYPFVKY